MQLSLDPRQALPLVDQIVEGLRTHIDDRVLRTGARLPPIRQFAAAHEVSKFTVVEAYERLVALGYLQSRRGSGFYVAQRRSPAEAATGPAPAARALDLVGVLRRGFEDDPQALKVGAGWLPPSWLDEDGIARTIRALSRRADLRPTSYGEPQGWAPLRSQLALRMADLGIEVGPQQVVLTHGATQALDLVARHLIRPGDCVLVDDPGYWTLFGNLRMHGAQLVGVPRNADGPDTATLEAVLVQHRPKVWFTQSVLHNPTAGSLSAAVAHQVLKLADRHDLLIVEDDTYADHQPGRGTRLATLDQIARVIYVGSFSKTLSANLRVGFLAASPDLAASLTDLKLLSALTTSEFSERMVHLMLTEGHYRKYIQRLHGRLAECIGATLRVLERAGLRPFLEPREGMFVWARVPGVEDSAGIAGAAVERRLLLAPGSLFRPQMQASPYLRFNVAWGADPRLERFLGEALAQT